MKSIERMAQWIEKPVTQEPDQTDWITLKNNKINIRPKEVPLLTGTKNIAYFNKNAVLPDRVFLLSDNEAYLVEDINSKVTDIDTTHIADVFGDNSNIATYTFDGNTDDLNGNYNTTIVGDITYTSSIFDRGVTCTSPDTTPDSDYIPLPVSIFNNADVFTISLWFKANSINTSYENAILSNYNCTTGQVLFSITISASGHLHVTYWDRSKTDTPNDFTVENIKINTWYHVVFTVDKVSNTMQLYVNSKYIGSIQNTAISGSLSEEPRLFGWVENCTEVNMISLDGIIEQVRISNRALTEDEVKALYAEQSKKYVASEYTFTSDIKKAFEGTDIYMTLGKSKLTNMLTNRLRRNINVDVKNTDIGNGKLGLHIDLENDPIIYIDNKRTNINIIDTTSTLHTADMFGDNSNIATYTFDDSTANDLNGKYIGVWKDKDGNDVSGLYDAGIYGGRAAKFDGNRYVKIPSLSKTLPMSISLWFKTTQKAAGTYDWYNPTLIGVATPGEGSSDFGIEIKNGYIGTFLGFGVEDYYYSDLFVADDVWHNVVLVLDNKIKVAKVYVDNKLIYERAINSDIVTDADNWYIGAMYDYYDNSTRAGSYFVGLIDQIRVFNKPLNNDKVRTVYKEQQHIIDVKSLGLTKIPELVQLPYKKPLNVLSVSDKKVTVSEFYNITHYTKALVDGKTLDVVNVDTSSTTDIADIFGDGSCVACYTFDNETADDLSGKYNGTWKDKDGNTISGTYDVGVFGGKAAKFNGNNYIELPIDPSNFAGSKPFTISVFFTFDRFDDNWSRVIDFGGRLFIGHVEDTNCLAVHHRLNDNYSGVRIIDDTTNYRVSLVSNKIYHLVVTFDGSNYSLWLNGERLPVATRTVEGTTPDLPDKTFIGKSVYNSNGLTHGMVDHIRIFNRAIIEDEVKKLYTEGKQILELSEPVSSDIVTVEFINESVMLEPIKFRPSKATPIGSDTEVDVIEVEFEEYRDKAGYRTVQRGLIIEKPEVEIIEPFTSTVTKVQE